MEFGIRANVQNANRYVFGQKPTAEQERYGMSVAGSLVESHLLNCCGLAGFSCFGAQQIHSFALQASFIEGLYKSFGHTGHMIYAITDYQADASPTARTRYSEARKGDGSAAVLEHKVFLKIGARMLAEFPNLFHGPNKIQLWLVNLRDAKGVFLDASGKALKEEPKAKEVEAVVAKAIEVVQPEVAVVEVIKAAAPKRIRKKTTETQG